MPDDVALAISANVAVIETLNIQIHCLEDRLLRGVRLRPDYALLKSMPGVGEVLATVIMLETGSVERFADVGKFASYTVRE